MGIAIEKLLAQLLFWVYDFIDTISEIFNILTGTQSVNGDKQTLLEVLVESAVSTKILLGLCAISIIIAGACMGVKIVKNVMQFKSSGETTPNAVTVKEGFFAVLSSVACIFFVFMFIAFASMLLNMVNNAFVEFADDTEQPATLAQNLFGLSVQQSYVIDEDTWETREITEHVLNDDGSWMFIDNNGNGGYDDGDEYVYETTYEYYHPYIIDESGWYTHTVNGETVHYTASDIDWSMSPDTVFGVHTKDWLGFEQSNGSYTTKPMVYLSSFNLFTAYLAAIIMLISLFVMAIGLVKRIYDIVVLIFCMPLVCGTIPLDDGARFRAWRETMMSKVLIVFGAVIGINVFFMLSSAITTLDMSYLINNSVLTTGAVTIFKMLLLLGGALCIYGSQTLIARILGTSADESREAMQSLNLVTGGVRLGVSGAALGLKAAGFAKRLVVGGQDKNGKQHAGIIPTAFRGINKIGEKAGGEGYTHSRAARAIRWLGRLKGNPDGDRGGDGGGDGGGSQGGSQGGWRGGSGRGRRRNGRISEPDALINPTVSAPTESNQGNGSGSNHATASAPAQRSAQSGTNGRNSATSAQRSAQSGSNGRNSATSAQRSARSGSNGRNSATHAQRNTQSGTGGASAPASNNGGNSAPAATAGSESGRSVKPEGLRTTGGRQKSGAFKKPKKGNK